MRLRVLLLVMTGAMLSHPLAAQMPTPGAELMVWQQGVNANATWKQLGCPRAYESDADKEQMISRGQCLNANPDGSLRSEGYVPDNRPMWQRLGCPRDYSSDVEKDEMISRGLCRNAR